MRIIYLVLFLASTIFADLNMYQTEPKVSVQNTLLAKVNGTTISVMDVMKKMDMILHQNYPQYADSPQARMQFYSTSWRPVFMEMIDTELMLADAQDKEVKLSDGEIREELESRFGPNVIVSLDRAGLTFEDAWKLIKNELIVRRMSWFYVHSKALQSVSPQAIRDGYRQYLSENPSYQEWIYRVVTLKGDGVDESLAEEIHRHLTEAAQSPELAIDLKEWESEHSDCKLQISNEFKVKDLELSESHKTALSSLNAGAYSQPLSQISRADNKPVFRIFYLAQKTDHPALPFETVASQVKNELLQKAVAHESEHYMTKLRKHYGFDPARIKETVPDDLQPFRMQ
ncbi:MAG: hypothetical protein HW387_1392 [Parachlamydiales bacterium]|nr:hypothetical protein [Parachlamydiales bacterium]